MATETVASLGPYDFIRETDLGNDNSVSLVLAPGESVQPGTSGVPGGDIRGLSLPKYKTSGQQAYGYAATFRIPGNLTLATGLTFKVYLTDDGSSSNDLGKNISLGITLKRLAANATDDVDVSAATEVITACTLSSSSAGISITSIAIANASLPSSAAVGDLLLIRVRRKGSDATNDTCPGRALLLRVEVINT